MKYSNLADLVAEYVITMDMSSLAELTRYKIANHFGVNRSHLSETFKKDTRMTVLQFLDLEKMKRAEILLRTRFDLTVDDIARQVGIVKCKQFRVKFKRIFGFNPGKYRSIYKRAHAGRGIASPYPH